jgi:hypothetical protein
MTSAMFIISLLCITVMIYISMHIRQKSHAKRRFIPYVKNGKRKKNCNEPLHLYVAFCNHLSPFRGNVSQEIAEHRIVTWQREYTRFASEHRDSLGNQPVHTFFYDESDYNPHFIDTLHRMCRNGIADVEILLRHGQNTSLHFKRKVEGFRDVLFHHHGLLRRNGEDICFAFVHDYTTPCGSHSQSALCDVNQKPLILKECGCYADFTFPRTPDTTEPGFINSIHVSKTKTNQKKRASVKNWSQDDLLLIEGPLGINWRNRRFCLFPRIENGEISARSRFTPHRARLWLDTAPQVEGDTRNLFLKLHTYGAVDSTVRYLFGESGIHELHGYLERASVDNSDLILHYVSAYEMYRKIQTVCQDAAKMPENVSGFSGLKD